MTIAAANITSNVVAGSPRFESMVTMSRARATIVLTSSLPHLDRSGSEPRIREATMDELIRAEHNRLALRLAMACTLALARNKQMPGNLAKLCAAELRHVAQVTEQDEAQLQLAAQMNTLALHLERV